ncbi:hypothetical protein GLIP_0829 [Aliiglaciecola lipolytica E3]|uniref:Uncharacterized protein n=1 Tax=Aliiglaciecola lipolytica E3 TaxID=1127673 RepID=K6WYD7_9ALTE|nr:hypothetical protein GLIP_0829 [Aliiglaciecola lipolytica E3]
MIGKSLMQLINGTSANKKLNVLTKQSEQQTFFDNPLCNPN